jgi:3-isopropylmalate dehydrogenase
VTTDNQRVLVLPGDGIGPEVTAATRTVLDWFQKKKLSNFQITDGLIGGASVDKYGAPLTDETLQAAHEADAVLLGAIGGAKWDDLPRALRPESGLLRLRKELGLFANLRPVRVSEALLAVSTVKPDVLKGVDLVIVRELIGGVYFGEPRGIEELGGIRRGFDTQSYSTPEIQRIARVAFHLARERRNHVCSVDKSNVMESGAVWRDETSKLHAREFPDVRLSHMYADNCAMQLVRAPTQFDVILTDNLFGDILSDLASMLPGSLGLLPSASLRFQSGGHQVALYEPIHGSAPDIAGKEIANPIAMILSLAMMFRYSFQMNKNAQLIEEAVQRVLSTGIRTSDIIEGRQQPVSTGMMAAEIVNQLSLHL